MEPAKAEFHSFVREQRQVETSGNRSRVPINSVFAFCNQPGFRSRRNLHKVSNMCFEVISIFSCSNTCAALDLSVDSISGEGPSDLHPVFTVSLNGVAIDHEKVKGTGRVCRILCDTLYLHREAFSLRLGLAC